MPRSFASASSQYFGYTSAAIVTAAPLTMACWIKPTSLVNSCALSLIKSSDTTHLFVLQPWGDAKVYATAQAGGGSQYATSATTITAGYWYHICAVFNTASPYQTVYIDGPIGKGTNTTNATPSGLDRTYICSIDATQQFVNGLIAEPCIWNVALTDGEVARLAGGDLPESVRPETISAQWAMDGTWGANEWNISPRQTRYTMTAVNGPSYSFDRPARLRRRPSPVPWYLTGDYAPAAPAATAHFLTLLGVGG